MLWQANMNVPMGGGHPSGVCAMVVAVLFVVITTFLGYRYSVRVRFSELGSQPTRIQTRPE